MLSQDEPCIAGAGCVDTVAAQLPTQDVRVVKEVVCVADQTPAPPPPPLRLHVHVPLLYTESGDYRGMHPRPDCVMPRGCECSEGACFYCDHRPNRHSVLEPGEFKSYFARASVRAPADGRPAMRDWNGIPMESSLCALVFLKTGPTTHLRAHLLAVDSTTPYLGRTTFGGRSWLFVNPLGNLRRNVYDVMPRDFLSAPRVLRDVRDSFVPAPGATLDDIRVARARHKVLHDGAQAADLQLKRLRSRGLCLCAACWVRRCESDNPYAAVPADKPTVWFVRWEATYDVFCVVWELNPRVGPHQPLGHEVHYNWKGLPGATFRHPAFDSSASASYQAMSPAQIVREHRFRVSKRVDRNAPPRTDASRALEDQFKRAEAFLTQIKADALLGGLRECGLRLEVCTERPPTFPTRRPVDDQPPPPTPELDDNDE